MKANKVPQDHISTYAENKKAIYATDEKGHYCVVASSGWDVEEEATRQALHELERLADDAYEQVARGDASPLLYHMYAQRMDIQVLAQTSRMFQWRIKRHFRPKIFVRLNDEFLTRYSDVLGISIDALKVLPKRSDDA